MAVPSIIREEYLDLLLPHSSSMSNTTITTITAAARIQALRITYWHRQQILKESQREAIVPWLLIWQRNNHIMIYLRYKTFNTNHIQTIDLGERPKYN